MVMVPAVLVGAFLVFALGYALTNGAIVAIDALKQKIWKSSSPSDDTEGCSVMGGVFTVFIMIILIVALPEQARYLIWYLLTFLGVIVGLLSLSQLGSRPSTRDTIERENISHQSDGKQRQQPNPGYQKTWQPNTSQYSSPANLAYRQPTRDSLYQDLVIKTKNNIDLVNRLIEYERQHKPGVSEVELIKNAIERWERDNR